MCQPCRTITGRVFSAPQRPRQIKMASGFLIGLTAEKLNKIINKTKIKNLFCLISVPLKRPTAAIRPLQGDGSVCNKRLIFCC